MNFILLILKKNYTGYVIIFVNNFKLTITFFLKHERKKYLFNNFIQ